MITQWVSISFDRPNSSTQLSDNNVSGADKKLWVEMTFKGGPGHHDYIDQNLCQDIVTIAPRSSRLL